MTEEEWLACTEPLPMLDFLRGKASDRKLRLVACACVRRLGGHLKDERAHKAITVTERYADGEATKSELRQARQAVRAAQDGLVIHPTRRAEANAYEAVAQAATEKDFAKAIPAAWAVARLPATGVRVARDQFPALYLRDVVGNLFRLTALTPSWLNWNDATVRKMAELIYREGAFERLPFLADALEEAGCDNANILCHLRSGGDHVRGCWAVDLILGKK